MLTLDNHPTGRHFLQIPGPSPVPDRILRAMSLPTIDHRGPEFGQLGLKVLAGIQQVFKTRHPVVIYPASGTGAWEAALINTLSPGDHVLMFETGHFASLWQKMATRLGLSTEFLSYGGSDEHLPQAPGWRHGVQAGLIEARLRKDTERRIRAVCVVHNETSTGVTSDIAAVRRAIDAAGHPALLLVDTISSLGSMDYRHDEWGVDVTVSGSQKGLMCPPGMAFVWFNDKARARCLGSNLRTPYWDWTPRAMSTQYWQHFGGTAPTHHLFGLGEALRPVHFAGGALLMAGLLLNVFGAPLFAPWVARWQRGRSE